jgi:hypothetical protein
MARVFAINIDLAKNQLINARIHNAPSNAKPANPGLGQIYFDTTDNFLYFWNGTSWLRASGDFGAGGQTTSLTFGNTKSDGTSTAVARADHTHEIPDIVGTTGEVTVSKNSTTGDATIGLPDEVTVTTKVTAPTFDGDLSGNADTATQLATAATVELTGDVTGTTTWNGNGTLSISTTVAANSVALGTDTTGNYVAGVSVSGNGISATGTGEGASVAISSNATADNVASTTVFRDSSGNFSANRITVENLTINQTPTQSTDAATKGYVDGLKQGLDVKDSVKVATTANIALDQTTAQVDGVTLADGDRVLVKNQADPIENGIWVVSTTTSWTRALDAVNGKLTGGSFFFVEQGSANGDNGFVLATNGTPSVGTVGLVFTQFSGAGQIDAGSGMSKIGNQLNVNTGLGLEIVDDNVRIDTAVVVRKAAATIPGDSTSTSFAITHNLGTDDTTVQVFRSTGDKSQVEVDVEHTDTNTVTIKMAQTPNDLGLGAFRVVIHG